MRRISILVGILRKPTYAAIATFFGVIVFTGAVWLPNLATISLVIKSSVTLLAKLQFIFSLYGSITTNFTLMSASYTVLIAFLFGIQAALLLYYIKAVRLGSTQLRNVGATSIGGLVSGVFGIGCAACGTFILTSVLTLFGVGGLVAYLPFGGEEFGVIGVLLLVYSVYVILNKIDKPLVCPV